MLLAQHNRTVSAKRRVSKLIAAGLGAITCLALSPHARAQVLADSVQDFSGVQGQNGWYYGFYNGDSEFPFTPLDFEELPIFDGVWRRSTTMYWTAITRMGQHPNGLITSGGRTPEDNWAVRRWVSRGTNIVRISGEVWDRAPSAGNGVITRITLSGSPLFEHVINNGETTPFAYSVETCIGAGNAIDFIVDPRDHDDQADDTGFTAVITSILQSGPQDQRVCTSGTATFSVTVNGSGSYFYQWRHNGANIPGASHPTLVLTGVTSSDAGTYNCLIASDCGVMTSGSAMLTFCLADFNCDGFVNSQDFFDFLTAFFSVDPSADFNHDAFINSQDFFDFITQFFMGCT